MENRATEPGPSPPNMIDQQWSFLTPVVLDTVPSGARLPHKGLAQTSSPSKGVLPPYLSVLLTSGPLALL